MGVAALPLTAKLILAASALSAVSSISQGRAANKQAEFTAAVGRQHADRTRQISASEEEDFRRRQAQAFGEMRAARGVSGTESGTGSSLLSSQDFAAETELQARRIRAGGETQATRLEQQAELTRRVGRSLQRRGLLRAGASLLSGAAEAFDR